MRRYLIILNILFITGIVFLAVKIFYKFATVNIDHSYSTKTESRHLVPSNADAPTQQGLPHYQPIIERNLFKTKTESGSEPDKLDIEALQPTELKLDLLGTITGDKKEAYAVIEDIAIKKQDLYRIGDTIQNATIKMILREKVVLNVNGKDEILGIEKVSGSRKIKRSSRNLAAATSQNITINRSQIDTAIKDVNTLMKQIRIRPHFTNGKPDGFRLTGIRPNSIFYNMGLKSGDIIMGVDGKDIESVDDALKFYQNLQSSSRLQLQIKRRGRLKTIDYHIE